MHDGLDDVTMRPTQIRVHKLQLELEDNHINIYINHVCIKQDKRIMVWCRSWSFCTRRTESDYAMNSGPHNGEWFGHVNREGKVEKHGKACVDTAVHRSAAADAGRDDLSLQRFVAAAAAHDFELRLPEHRGSSAANAAGGAFRRLGSETNPSILETWSIGTTRNALMI